MVLSNVPNANVPRRAFSSITPFTYPDGITHLKLLEMLRYYATVTLPESIEKTLGEFDADITARLQAVLSDVIARLETQTEWVEGEVNELRDEVNAAIEAVINNSIELQAEVVKGIEKAVYGRVTLADYLADAGGDFREALLAALADVPDNGTIFIPSGTYDLNATVAWPVDKNVTIDGNNAKIVTSVSGYAFDFTGGYESPVAVSDLTTATIPATDDGSTWTTSPMPAVTFNAGVVTGWRRGDIVKIVSDDALEGQRDQGTDAENPNSQARYGQHMQVHEAIGSMVTLIGSLREADKYVSNIRAARLSRNNRVVVRNLTVEMPDSYYTPEDRNAVSGIRFMDLYRPTLSGFEMQGHNAAITFNSCYQYECVGNYVGLLRNKVASVAGGERANYGYGVIDIGSEYGSVLNNTFNQCRHGFTDDSGRGTANREVGRYGRTFGTIVSGNKAYATSNASFDTHACGDSISFTNNVSVSSNGGVQLRGTNHVVDGLTVVDSSGAAINVIDEGSAWGWSHSHSISNVKVKNSSTAIVVRFHVGGPFDSVRETRAIRLSNIHCTGLIGHSIVAQNAAVYANDVTLGLSGASDNGYGIINLDNSEFIGRNVEVDTRGAGPMSHAVIRVVSGTANVDGYIVRFDSDSAPSRLLSTAETGVRLRRGWLTGRLSSASPTGNTVSWETSAGARPAHLAKSGADIETSANITGMIQDAEAPSAVLMLNPDGEDRTLGALANAPVIGQRLVIINVGSTGSVMIPHGAAANTQNRGAATVTLAPQQEAEYVFYGSWRQTWAV